MARWVLRAIITSDGVLGPDFVPGAADTAGRRCSHPAGSRSTLMVAVAKHEFRVATSHMNRRLRHAAMMIGRHGVR